MSSEVSVDFEISDIIFHVTRHGNLKPILVFSGAEELNLEIPNIPLLIKAGIMVGDIVAVSSPYEDMLQVYYRPGDDRSPPEIPTHCPCCGSELTMTVGRYTVIQCRNKPGCSAQVNEVDQ